MNFAWGLVLFLHELEIEDKNLLGVGFIFTRA